MKNTISTTSCILLLTIVYAAGQSLPMSILRVIPPDTKPSDLLTCAKIAIFLENCWMLGADLPNCNGISHLQACADFILKNSSQCKNELISRFFVSTAQNYQNSDKILCENGLYKEFLADLDCWIWARLTATRVVYLTKGFITSDGCKAAYFSVALMKTIMGPKCGGQIGKYVDPLFKATACGSEVFTNELYLNDV